MPNFQYIADVINARLDAMEKKIDRLLPEEKPIKEKKK